MTRERAAMIVAGLLVALSLSGLVILAVWRG